MFPAADPGFPKDYKVEDYGEDPEIRATLDHEKLASQMVKHNWDMGSHKHFEEYRNKALDTLYDYEPELDSDIKNTLKHADKAEANLELAWGA